MQEPLRLWGGIPAPLRGPVFSRHPGLVLLTIPDPSPSVFREALGPHRVLPGGLESVRRWACRGLAASYCSTKGGWLRALLQQTCWFNLCLLCPARGGHSPPQSQPLGFLGAPQERCLRCAICLLWGADLRLQPSWQMSTVQDPRKTWLATGACSQFGGGCWPLGLRME